ncbi:Glycerate kinase [Fasciola gigantica]|uniref:Glycerate kinase n=1 Tax=Fasciola gigantica TaxID=46835 RepID=A0A504YP55_FASGI|nr:Glycerate kinase [Fasciola gigantica]
MVKSVVDVLHDHVDSVVCCIPPPTQSETSGATNVLELQERIQKLHMFYGSYSNLPTEEIVRGSQLMAEIAESLDADDMLIVCLTGGGSALLTLPMEFQSKQMALDAILEITRLLSQSGAEICELNTVRSCLDRLKAGGLASLARPAQIPTVIRQFLESEQSNPTRPEPMNEKVDNWILGNNRVALEAAAESLRKCCLDNEKGVHVKPIILTTSLSGDSTTKGKMLGEFLWSIALHLNWLQDHRTEGLISPYEETLTHLHAELADRQTGDVNVIMDTCYELVQSATETQNADPLVLTILLGGETTTVGPLSYTLDEEKPVGGRCSHMALSAAIRWYEMAHEKELKGLNFGQEVTLLAAASDGLDGPSFGGAGVWVAYPTEPVITGRLVFEDAVNALNKKDSYGFFRQHAPSCIIPAKLTDTNVMDIFIGTVMTQPKLK